MTLLLVSLASPVTVGSLAAPSLLPGRRRRRASPPSRRAPGQDRDTGRDARITMRMKLFDRQGRMRDRCSTCHAARPRRTRAPPAAPDGDRLLMRFTYPNDIKRHQLSGLGASGRRGRAVSLSAVARPRPPHRRLRDAGELRRQRLHLRGHRRPRVRGLHLQFAGADGDARGPRRTARPRPPVGSSRSARTRTRSFRASSRSCGRTTSSSSARRSSTAATSGRRSIRRRIEQVEGIWTVMDSEMTDTGADPHRARRREGRLQHRPEGRRLQPARAGAGDGRPGGTP